MKTSQVKKRDDLLEPYDIEKLKRVLMAANCTVEQAQVVSTNITQWFYEQPEPVITSLKIRDKVLEELQKVNASAANLFAWYEKTKEPDNEAEQLAKL